MVLSFIITPDRAHAPNSARTRCTSWTQEANTGGWYDLCRMLTFARDGTTDVTRTCHLGKDDPTPHMKKCFTRVLQGHIDLDRAVFPNGTSGTCINISCGDAHGP